MSNLSMPAVNRVQSKKQALPGVMRIVPEGTRGAWYVPTTLRHLPTLTILLKQRPGDNPFQCAQGFNCPPPSVSLDNFSPITDRYFDIGAGGPTPFTFTATSNTSWLKLSVAKGNISPKAPEQRVFVSIPDWSKLKDGSNSAQVTFKATAAGQADLSLTVTVFAQKNSVLGGFKGLSKKTTTRLLC